MVSVNLYTSYYIQCITESRQKLWPKLFKKIYAKKRDRLACFVLRQITKANKTIVYEIGVKGKDILFDANGKFIEEAKD